MRYAQHPAFRKHGPVEETFEGLDQFLEIDTYLTELFQNPRVMELREIESYFDDKIIPRTSALGELVRSSMNPKCSLISVTLDALADLCDELKREAVYRNLGNSRKAYSTSSALFSRNADLLREQGFFHSQLDQDLLLEFWNGIEPWRNALDAKRKGAPRGQASCVVPLPQEGVYWQAFRRAIARAGIQESVNSYSRLPLDLDYCVLQLSHPDECWWKDCYADEGISTSKASYMHYDQDYSLIKAIVYLQPVTTNGPFSLIPASEVAPVSYSREAFFKRLDGRVASANVGGDTDCVYYRKQFKSPDFRREFLRIPSALRGTSHFGDDILDGTSKSDWLLRHERKITTDVANCTVFTGGRTVHRGGLVESGERWALQLGFRERDPSWVGLKNRVKRHVKATLPMPILQFARKFSQ